MLDVGCVDAGMDEAVRKGKFVFDFWGIMGYFRKQ